MSIKFANNAFGTLNAGISSSDTSITLSSGQGARFPVLASGEYFYITLIDTSNNLEVVKCTARSTDVLTIVRAQDNTTARSFVIGDRVELRVTAAALEDSTNPYDKDTSSTGSFALPVGTTAQQPAAADTEGHIRYDSDDSVVYFSDGANWIKISSTVPVLSSVTGDLFAGFGTTLTLAGTGFLAANLGVRFVQASDGVDETVTVTPASDTSATVTVPSAVYNNVTGGNVVSITVTNEDNVTSASVSKTALALPSGGTVVTNGNYRTHIFKSSGTFTNTVSNLSVDYLVVAGGGSGGFNDVGGGGGAGGMVAVTGSTLSVQGYTVTVGAGGAAPSSNSAGNNGSNSSFNSTTCIGGGGGGPYNGAGASGGSGGGGSYASGAGGAGTAGQGNNGGAQSGFSPRYGAGGGGGKGGVGQNGSATKSGDGGAGGTNSLLTTSEATANSVGEVVSGAVYFAGGGGGSGEGSPSSADGIGGNGGGGNGATNTIQPQAGAANTGGGGGGIENNVSGVGGGSGVVLIKYQLT